MLPVGQWNHLEITCDKNLITVSCSNGQQVTRMDLDQWTEKNKRPDGTEHKFDVAYKDHPRHGYIGLQITAASAGTRTTSSSGRSAASSAVFRHKTRVYFLMVGIAVAEALADGLRSGRNGPAATGGSLAFLLRMR